ncbi:hypothetical protein GBA63_05050 [Rubrobacter tropicus]|uniref:Cysteine dioxygenase type I n=1 Tax=Rubrobacter tropicus TaxID=2653851 RepID=A0A6G8Q6M5_9ACTN|nr:hypothetical protein [Rubrobacter tropicus]QIN82078.1 hypothetical protein GBA63_05050 [Rubrobacter tropicus]
MTLAYKDKTTEILPMPPMGLTLLEAVAHLRRELADPRNPWLGPILEGSRGAEDWYVAHRRDAPDGSYSLQVFVWPAGSWTRVHDHSSWGLCAAPSATWPRNATSAWTTERFSSTPA